MKKKFSVHFVGIKGVGMTPLAIIAQEAGFGVTGSDIAEEYITKEALDRVGIRPFTGFSAYHVGQPDLVITTGAHGGFDNIEVKTAREKQIKVIAAGEAVGLFMEGKILGRRLKGISVAGSHGKTTTTAMIATVLKEAGIDPSFVVGTGDVGSLGAPGHFGKGAWFVAEADEYANEPQYDRKARFLYQHPVFAVFTNIEFDHPDIYPSLDAIRETFLQFANQVDEKGALIVCGDDRQVQQLLKSYTRKSVTYGFKPDNDYVIKRYRISGEQTFFLVETNGITMGQYVLRVAGEHNALNALAAIIVCSQLGVSPEGLKKGLMAFRGSKRRLEFIGELGSGANVYDDYAHHPTEITTTLAALRKQYPKKKIICIFQPHTYSRTKLLFNEFARAFGDVDMVILTDIFASQRESPDPAITSGILAGSMKSLHKQVMYLSTLENVVEYVRQKRFGADTILVTMGAGDVYKIHSNLEFV